MAPTWYSGSWGKLICEKNQKLKDSLWDQNRVSFMYTTITPVHVITGLFTIFWCSEILWLAVLWDRSYHPPVLLPLPPPPSSPHLSFLYKAHFQLSILPRSVADSDPGSGAFLTAGSGIRNGFFPDPGSRIPNPHFWGLSYNFLGKKFYSSSKIGPNIFLQHFKNKIITSFVKFVATKKGLTKEMFSPLSLVTVFGSGIRNPKSAIRDPGSGIHD